MYYLSMILIALCSNIDNLVVGIAMGIKNLRINMTGNLTIALISFIGTYLSMSLGKFFISFIYAGIANYIGGIFLIVIGTQSLTSALISTVRKAKQKIKEHDKEILSYSEYIENPEKVDINKSGFIDLKESIILGFVLAVNNIGVGFGAGISKFDALISSILTFILSTMALFIGLRMGKQLLSKTIEKYAGITSSCIIILLGILELIIN